MDELSDEWEKDEWETVDHPTAAARELELLQARLAEQTIIVDRFKAMVQRQAAELSAMRLARDREREASAHEIAALKVELANVAAVHTSEARRASAALRQAHERLAAQATAAARAKVAHAAQVATLRADRDAHAWQNFEREQQDREQVAKVRLEEALKAKDVALKHARAGAMRARRQVRVLRRAATTSSLRATLTSSSSSSSSSSVAASVVMHRHDDEASLRRNLLWVDEQAGENEEYRTASLVALARNKGIAVEVCRSAAQALAFLDRPDQAGLRASGRATFRVVCVAAAHGTSTGTDPARALRVAGITAPVLVFAASDRLDAVRAASIKHRLYGVKCSDSLDVLREFATFDAPTLLLGLKLPCPQCGCRGGRKGVAGEYCGDRAAAGEKRGREGTCR